MRDAIVVLGDALLPDGGLSRFGRERVTRSVELLRAGEAPRLLLCGKGPGRGPGQLLPIEAQAMRELALTLGAKDGEVFLETESDSTLQNAWFAKVRILQPHRWRKLMLVTSAWHVERALLTFERVLGAEYEVTPLAVPDGLAGEEQQRRRELERYYTAELHGQLDGMDEPDHARIEALIEARRKK